MHCALDKKEEALDVNSSWHIDRVVGVGIDHIGHRSAKISKDCKGCYSLFFLPSRTIQLSYGFPMYPYRQMHLGI